MDRSVGEAHETGESVEKKASTSCELRPLGAWRPGGLAGMRESPAESRKESETSGTCMGLVRRGHKNKATSHVEPRRGIDRGIEDSDRWGGRAGTRGVPRESYSKAYLPITIGASKCRELTLKSMFPLV